MEDKRAVESGAAAPQEGDASRKRYERPELVTFGSVRDLTRTGTKGGFDAGTRRN